jgi:hypothetical protein
LLLINKIYSKGIILRIVILLLIIYTFLLHAQAQWQSTKVYYNGNGKLAYVRDASGNQIPDFSYAGYKNGNFPIPTIAVVDSVSPVTGDNTTNIQNAIDRVASRSLDVNGFRGALLMKAGRYRVSGTLLLDASGIVLRGVGEGSDTTTNTVIYATGDSLTQSEVLIAGGGNGGSNGSAWSGALTSNVNIVTDSVHVGDYTFQVTDASQFSVGDNIVIYHPDTTPWKRAVDWGGVPNDTGVTSYWAGVTIPIKYNRFITAINGNFITIDAPVFNTLVRSLSQSYIYKTDRNNIKTNIGIENLRVDIINPYNQSPTNSNGDERHHSQNAIWLGKIEDAWIRHCTTLHFVHAGFMTSIATRVTIDSCSAIDPISIIDGSRRYNFNTYTASQLILFSNCYASYPRHACVSNGTSTVSGVVFYNCTADESYNASEGHRLWSQGLLYDNFKDINTNVVSSNHVLGLYNRGDMGSGHGWAAAHSVAWNCNTGTSAIVIQKPPTAQNYAIGCFGNVTGAKPPAPFSQPQGYIEGTNVSGLNPQSLYKAQFNDRQFYIITATAGANGTISPSGDVSVNTGFNQTFTFNPFTGYHVDSVFVDGVSRPVAMSYTFTNVQTNHTIRIVFRINTYTITATAGVNGSINPSGVVTVTYGAGQLFSFTPLIGYHVDSVFVDGLSQMVDTSYAFTNVQANHTIRVVFRINTYTITATAGENGSISPSGAVIVNYDTNQKFTFTPLTNYHVDSVIVDGISQTMDSIYTFTNIKANHTIRVVFSINIDAITINIQGKWNLISLPLDVPDPKKTTLFPTAVSDAFAYSTGYVKKESLSVGTGYWLKFDSAESVNIPGLYRLRDTIDLITGWNLIGSISRTIAVSSISSEPGGMVASQFFGYSNGYQNTDSIYPGKGYWVKVNQTGKFILVSSGVAQTSKAIRIEYISEFPPPVPDGELGEAGVEPIPTEFSLSQNFPNPFNPVTTIYFQIPVDSYVLLKIYDQLGQDVATLVDGPRPTGKYQVKWDAANHSSGIYFFRLQTEHKFEIKKLVLIR